MYVKIKDSKYVKQKSVALKETNSQLFCKIITLLSVLDRIKVKKVY